MNRPGFMVSGMDSKTEWMMHRGLGEVGTPTRVIHSQTEPASFSNAWPCDRARVPADDGSQTICVRQWPREDERMSVELSAIECHVTQFQAPCRVCTQIGLNPVLSHGDEPVLGESTWPVDLVWCPTCSLVQWTAAASSNGPSGHSPPAGRGRNEESHSLAGRLIESRQFGQGSLVVAIAGTDAGLLQSYQDAGIPVVSIGPVRSPARAGGPTPGPGPGSGLESESGVPMITEPFGQDVALELVRTNNRADVVHAGSGFANIGDLNGVVSGFATLLKKEGIAVVEVPYLRDLADHVGFHTPAPEELCYFSLTSLTQLFGQHGLEIVDVEHLKVQGGMLRITAARFGTASVTPAVHDLMFDESAWVRDPAFYESFGETLVDPSRDRWAA
jgi:hypothetical protein